MSIFNNKKKAESILEETMAAMERHPLAMENRVFLATPDEPKLTVKPEEWVWVEGFKGTDKDMKCRDYQFELNKQFDMPEGEEIIECQSGFHLCLKLEDVFGYYDLHNGNRFFKVRALVRAKDIDLNHKKMMYVSDVLFSSDKTKLTSKSIIFLEELGTDEIFDVYVKKYPNWSECAGWTAEEKELARQESLKTVKTMRMVADLETLGFSKPFAEYAVDAGYYYCAKAAGSQEGLSMDMKVLAMFKFKEDHDEEWRRAMARSNYGLNYDPQYIRPMRMRG